jgi:hypothetical protein
MRAIFFLVCIIEKQFLIEYKSNMPQEETKVTALDSRQLGYNCGNLIER